MRKVRGWRLSHLQAARAAARRPDLSRFRDPSNGDTITIHPVKALSDWPEILHAHDTWWQVHRLELHGAEAVKVLVHETADEEQAIAVALEQASQAIVSKWGDRQPPFVTHRPPRRVP